MNGTTQWTKSNEGGTFHGLCGLWGIELVEWNCCGSRTWVFGLINVESGQPTGIYILVAS